MSRSPCLLLGVFSLVIGGAPAAAVTFTVNSTQDEVDAVPGDGACATATGACTLRAAIQEANALAGADAITVPAGTYILMIAGQGEDAAATGDLDITDDVSITGAGPASTTVDGNGIDRVFDIGQLPNPNITVSISGMTIQNGNPGSDPLSSFGGGVLNNGLTTLSDVVVSGNVAAVDGGGIENDSDLTLSDVTVRNNTATRFGGGIDNASGLTLTGVAVTGNMASEGGGIENSSLLTPLMLINVTVSGNTASSSGGGIRNDRDVTLTNVTLSNNTAPSGAGLNNQRNATLAYVIVANNPTDQNCTGSAVTSAGHNLDSGNACGFTSTGDLINTDPALGPLQDNGGPTFTQALLTGSPAIDAGGNDCPPPATDQRGGIRPADGDSDGTATCDIGAFEFGAVFPTTTTSSTTSTTLPSSCPVEATFMSIGCRLDALIGSVQGDVQPGTLRDKLEKALMKAKARTQGAEQALGLGKARRAKAMLGKAGRALGKFMARLSTRKAQQQIDGTVRSSLQGAALQLRRDLIGLRGTL